MFRKFSRYIFRDENIFSKTIFWDFFEESDGNFFWIFLDFFGFFLDFFWNFFGIFLDFFGFLLDFFGFFGTNKRA